MIARTYWNKSLFAAVVVTCLFAASVPAMAGEIDPDRTGSVNVSIRAYATNDVVGGGSLQLYQIAGTAVTAAEGAGYHYTDGFSGCDKGLLTADELAKAETAEVFSEWVETHRIAADESVAVSAEGEAYFTDLSCGLYLVTQNEAAEGYHAINAFLVSVPFEEDGIWIYDVDATPKTSPVTKDTTEGSGITRTGTQTPEETGNTGGSGGTTAGGGGRTGDISGFLYGVLLIAAALVIVAVLRGRANRRER